MTTRSTLAPFAAAAVLLFLVGCTAPAVDDTATTTEPDTSTETESESIEAEGGANDEPAVDLPDTWPADVPVIDGRIVDAFAVGGDTVTFWGARVSPDAPLDTARDVAFDIMQSTGFELIGEADNDLGTRNRQYQSAEYTVFINISTAAGEEGVLYNVQPR